MKIMVYTCVVGRRDRLPTATEHGGESYECYADDPSRYKGRGWNCYPILHLENSPVRTARWHKMHPHFGFPNPDFFVWVDAHITPKTDLTKLVTQLDGDVAAFRHREREDPYQEIRTVLNLGLETKEVCQQSREKLILSGYPKLGGLHETGILILRNCEAVRHFLQDWWLETHFRDQLHFNRLVRRHQLKLIDLPGNVIENNYFDWGEHVSATDPLVKRLQRQWSGRIDLGKF